MFKNLNDQNYEGWIANRIKTFAGTLGDTWTVDNITAANFPLIEQVMNLSRIISSCHTLRRTLYIEILSLARQRTNIISNAFAEINHLIRSHELQHLILIDKYILEEHPEFLKTVVLRGLTQRFSRAISLLQQFPEDQQLYVKILQDKDRCSQLNRKAFEEAAIIATTIAEFKNSTFSNFFVSKTASALRLRDMTLEYLNLRYNLAPIAAGEYDKMTELEKSQFNEKMLQRIEEKMNNENAGAVGSEFKALELDIAPLPNVQM